MAKHLFPLCIFLAFAPIIVFLGLGALATANMKNTCRNTDNAGLCMLDYQAHGDVRAAIAAGNLRGER